VTNIKKYEEFLESVFSSLFKKNVPYLYSARFREILNSMIGSEIAKGLLYAENSNQVSDDITLIDITESEDKVSFIQLNRISRMRDEDTTFSKKEDIVEYIETVWRYTQNNLEYKGWTQQRTEISIGRFVTRVFQKSKQTVTDKEIEKFVNSYKSRFKFINNIESRFEMVSGEDIRKWYLEKNYQFNRGQLSNSCMRHSECQSYFDIYVKNPEVCKLLILHGDDDSKITGRALIWKLKDGRTYMDRQYTNIESDKNVFIEYAKKQEWVYYGMGGGFKEMEVQLANHKYDEFPYMDTFIYYNHVSHLLSNNEEVWPSKDWHSLQNTNGSFTSGDVVWSEYHDCWIPREDAVNTVDQGWVRSDDARFIDSRNEWYSTDSDDICWSDYTDEYYHVDDAIFSEYLETWLPTDNSFTAYISSDDEWVALPNNMKNLAKSFSIGGEDRICLIESVIPNPFGEGWIFKKDTIKVFYCEKINDYITEEDAKMRNLQISSDYKTIEMIDYINSQIGEVDEKKLLNYLIEFKPTPELIKKMNEFFEGSYKYRWLLDEKTYTDIEKFNTLKAGIWFGYRNFEKNDYYRLKYSSNRGQKFLELHEKTLLKFIDQRTYDKLYTQNYFSSFILASEPMIFDIITDPEMVKIYIHLLAATNPR